MIRVGLIGDHDESVIAHRAIPLAIKMAAKALGREIEILWCPTELIDAKNLQQFHGLWCVPASPYRDMQGALRAICFARESGCPFLGTCGGFQHAVIEYARNAMNWTNAEHAEISPDAEQHLIAPLHCSMIETSDEVRFVDGSRLRKAYGTESSSEGYHCSYGLNPTFQEELTSGSLGVAAVDSAGAVRGLELSGPAF